MASLIRKGLPRERAQDDGTPGQTGAREAGRGECKSLSTRATLPPTPRSATQAPLRRDSPRGLIPPPPPDGLGTGAEPGAGDGPVRPLTTGAHGDGRSGQRSPGWRRAVPIAISSKPAGQQVLTAPQPASPRPARPTPWRGPALFAGGISLGLKRSGAWEPAVHGSEAMVTKRWESAQTLRYNAQSDPRPISPGPHLIHVQRSGSIAVEQVWPCQQVAIPLPLSQHDSGLNPLASVDVLDFCSGINAQQSPGPRPRNR